MKGRTDGHMVEVIPLTAEQARELRVESIVARFAEFEKESKAVARLDVLQKIAFQEGCPLFGRLISARAVKLQDKIVAEVREVEAELKAIEDEKKSKLDAERAAWAKTAEGRYALQQEEDRRLKAEQEEMEARRKRHIS